MANIGDEAPLYTIQRSDDDFEGWNVVGPHGIDSYYASKTEAQTHRDYLHEQVAEETEDDARMRLSVTHSTGGRRAEFLTL